MGYTIQYGQTAVIKKDNQEIRKKNRKKIIIICAVILIFTILFCFREFLYPGDREITKQALGNMADNIQSGQSMKQAFRVFCEEIIAGADLS